MNTMTIKIVLVEPKISGNIGAVARVMKNFDFNELVLINPQADIAGDAFRFAKHAQEVLDNIKIYDSLEEFCKTVTYVVGTTSKISTDKGSTNVRVAVSSNDPSLANILQFKGDVAILFGREDYGLTNEEIEFCDMSIHIPTSDDYKALNLAQSVAIIIYSLHVLKERIVDTHYREAKKEEKDLLIEWFEKAVSVLGYHERKSEFLVRCFRNIMGRSFVSGKEAVSLVGVFSRSYKRIKKCDEMHSK